MKVVDLSQYPHILRLPEGYTQAADAELLLEIGLISYVHPHVVVRLLAKSLFMGKASKQSNLFCEQSVDPSIKEKNLIAEFRIPLADMHGLSLCLNSTESGKILDAGVTTPQAVADEYCWQVLKNHMFVFIPGPGRAELGFCSRDFKSVLASDPHEFNAMLAAISEKQMVLA